MLETEFKGITLVYKVKTFGTPHISSECNTIMFQWRNEMRLKIIVTLMMLWLAMAASSQGNYGAPTLKSC